MKARYGSPRVHPELIAGGTPCCVETVAKLMRGHGIAAKAKRKSRGTTDSNHGRPVAGNVVGRLFEPGTANRVRAADITYIATRQGWLYLAAVEDLHSRRIVGRSMGDRIDSRLVVDALEMAVAHRLPRGSGAASPATSATPVPLSQPSRSGRPSRSSRRTARAVVPRFGVKTRSATAPGR